MWGEKMSHTGAECGPSISPQQSGSESSVEPRDSFGPQQLSSDLCGRHSHDLRRGAGVVGTAEDGAGSPHL